MFKNILQVCFGAIFCLVALFSPCPCHSEELRILEITPGWVGTSPPNITKDSEGVTYADFRVRMTTPSGGKFNAHVENAAGVIQKVRTETEWLGEGEYLIKFHIGNLPEVTITFEDYFSLRVYRVTPSGIIQTKR